jgi:cytoskeletal protein RodZ
MQLPDCPCKSDYQFDPPPVSSRYHLGVILLICLVFLLAGCQQEPNKTPTANSAEPTPISQSSPIPTESNTAVSTTEPVNTAETAEPTQLPESTQSTNQPINPTNRPAPDQRVGDESAFVGG